MLVASSTGAAAASGPKVRQSTYVPGLDLLRFFAATAVMIYHLAFWSWAFPAGQIARASGGVANFQSWDELTSFGWLGVQIFFVISGFVIALSGERATPYRFFTSRFVRLVPAVWICATITLAAWLLLDIGAPGRHVRDFIRSIGFHPLPPWIDSVYWTLGVEIAFYAIVFGLISLRHFQWLKPVMVSVGLVSTLFWFGYWIAAMAGAGMTQWFSAVQWSRFGQLLLVQHGVFFAIGVLLWLQLMKKRTLDQALWLGLFCVGALLQIAGETALKLEKTGLSFSPLWPILTWLTAMVFFWIAVTNNALLHQLPAWSLQCLRRLGLMTYPLYLLHNVAGGAVMGSLVRAGFSPATALGTTIVSMLALSWWVSVMPEPALQRFARSVFDAIEQRFTATRTAPRLTNHS